MLCGAGVSGLGPLCYLHIWEESWFFRTLGHMWHICAFAQNMIWILILFQHHLGQMQALRPRLALLSQNFRSLVVSFDKPFKWFRVWSSSLQHVASFQRAPYMPVLGLAPVSHSSLPQLRAPCLFRHSTPHVLQMTLILWNTIFMTTHSSCPGSSQLSAPQCS